MKKLLGILVLGLILYGCETTYVEQTWPFPWPQGLNKHSFTDRYLKNKSLAKIEGIWAFDSNEYEIAIVKNDFNIWTGYDYIGIVTDTNKYNWQRGEIKILLKKTITKNLFTGNYYMGDKSRIGRTFILNKGYIEVTLPVGYYGAPVKVIFIKSWPSFEATAEVPPKEDKSDPKPAKPTEPEPNLIPDTEKAKDDEWF